MWTRGSLDRIPLYVRAGSSFHETDVNMRRKAADRSSCASTPAPTRLHALRDENDNYNYEKGAYATIPIHWNDAGKQLTMGNARAASGDDGVPTFRVTFVGPGRGTGVAPAPGNTVVAYSGKAVTVLK